MRPSVRTVVTLVAGGLAVGSTARGADTREMELSFSPPAEIKMVVAGSVEKGSGVDKTGNCDAALTQAVDEVSRKSATIVSYVDDRLNVVTSASCEVNDKNKAVVKVRAVSVSPSTSDRAPSISGARAVEIVRAFQAHPPPTGLEINGPLFRLDEVAGHYFLDAGSYNYDVETFAFGRAGADRGSRIFWQAVQPVLPRIYESINAVSEVDGAEYVVTDKYIQQAADQGPTDEAWRFFFTEDLLGQYVAGLIGSQALIDQTRIMYTPKTSSNAWSLTTLKVGDVPQ